MTTLNPTAVADQPPRRKRQSKNYPIISLLLIAAVIALWVRSYHRSDTLLVCLHRGVAQGVVTDRGRFCIFTSNIALGVERQWTLVHWSQEAGAGEEAAAALDSEIAWSKSKLGFTVGRGNDDAMGVKQSKIAFVIAPVWTLIVLLAIPSLFFLRRAMRYRKRLRRGLCLACGYDLRGSQDRCPECGEAFTPRKAKPQPA